LIDSNNISTCKIIINYLYDELAIGLRTAFRPFGGCLAFASHLVKTNWGLHPKSGLNGYRPSKQSIPTAQISQLLVENVISISSHCAVTEQC